MAVVEHPAPTVSSAAGKTVPHASALAAVAQSVNSATKSSPVAKLKKIEESIQAAEKVEKKEPELDTEELRFWLRQTTVYVALLACVVGMLSAHMAGKSFLSTVMCGATAAILTGIAGTVVAHMSLAQAQVKQESAHTDSAA